MIKHTQENIQQGTNMSIKEAETLMHNISILSDNGYYTDKAIYQNYNEEQYT